MAKLKKCPKCGYRQKPGDRYTTQQCNGCGWRYSYDNSRRSGTKAIILFHVLFLILPLFTIYVGGWNEFIGAIKSKHTEFIQTTGVITSSKKERMRPHRNSRYRHDIFYGYVVEGILYVSNTITFEPKYKNVDELLRKYPTEKEVVVYFDKFDPGFSVLEPNTVGYDQLFRGIWGSLLCLIVFWLVVIVRLKYKIHW